MTSPIRCASAASKIRPVSISSCACAAPIRRGSSQLVPMSQADRPMRMNAALNRADAAAMRMSEPSTSAKPAAGGRTVDRGDDGLRQRAQVRDQRGDVLLHGEARLRAAEALGVRAPAVAAEVEPGAEAAPGPVSTTTRQAASVGDIVERVVQRRRPARPSSR